MLLTRHETTMWNGVQQHLFWRREPIEPKILTYKFTQFRLCLLYISFPVIEFDSNMEQKSSVESLVHSRLLSKSSGKCMKWLHWFCIIPSFHLYDSLSHTFWWADWCLDSDLSLLFLLSFLIWVIGLLSHLFLSHPDSEQQVRWSPTS